MTSDQVQRRRRKTTAPLLVDDPSYSMVADDLKHTADSVTISSKEKLDWICECGDRFTRAVFQVTRNGLNECRSCTGKRGRAKQIKAQLSPDKTLLAIHPDLAKEWHPDNPIGPDEIGPASHKEVLWKCQKCSHKWRDTVVDRVLYRSRSCPECLPEGSIGLTEWVEYLDPSQNGYQEILRLSANGSHRIVVWICHRCGEKFQRKISRTGEVVCLDCLGMNPGTVAESRPDLVQEWHPDNSCRPEDTSLYSWVRVDWICSECGEVWDASVANRTRGGSGCPRCYKRSGATSKLERSIRNKLSEILNEDVHEQVTVRTSNADKRRRAFLDMCTDDFIAVEYDSAYWHQDRHDSDVQRVLDVTAEGYTVISIREVGLEPIGDYTITYDPKRDTIREIAQQVADLIHTIRSQRDTP